MASIKDLKKRITSVKNTQQTTKAMKMVSAAKLRRAQDAILSHRPYALRLGELMRLVSTLPGIPDESPWIRKPTVSEPSELSSQKNRLLLVLVSSDRGLCGGFNGSIIKTAQRWIAKHSNDYESIQLSFVGRKAYDFFKTKKVNIEKYHEDLGGKVTFVKARALATRLIEGYLSEQFNEVKFIYNEFKNVVTQKVVVELFLPLINTELPPPTTEKTIDYLIKPNAGEVFNQLISKHFSVQAFRILLESQASEHGARMSAMENATNNAGEMIRLLTLQYNKERQAGITKELLEIISGSEAQKAS